MVGLRLAPGTEWVLTEPTEAIFRAPAAQATLRADALAAFVDGVVPLLDGSHDLEVIAAASASLPAPEFERLIGDLMQAGLVEAVPAAPPPSRQGVLAEVLAGHGRAEPAVRGRLSDTRFAVFGLDSAGTAVARLVAGWSPRAVVLADPSPPRCDDPSALPADGASRQAALADQLRLSHPDLRVETPLAEWGADPVLAAAGAADVLIAAVDRDFAAAAHWVNKAAIALNKPAAFVSIDGARALIGPIVYPDETACYMCYRMRAIACEDDYAAAMAFEERRDGQRSPSPRREPTFLPAVEVAAGILAGELSKTLTAVGHHVLAGRVLVWDGLLGELTGHDILRQPTCPVCSKKNC